MRDLCRDRKKYKLHAMWIQVMKLNKFLVNVRGTIGHGSVRKLELTETEHILGKPTLKSNQKITRKVNNI